MLSCIEEVVQTNFKGWSDEDKNALITDCGEIQKAIEARNIDVVRQPFVLMILSASIEAYHRKQDEQKKK